MNSQQEDGSKSVNVDTIIIHFDYMKMKNSYDADIAIVLLNERIKYTELIRPICLWSDTEDRSQLTGKTGSVFGWGLDEGGAVAPIPKKIYLPIVSQEICLKSHEKFHTSPRTFCAGKRDGMGPCYGDSGGGMTIRKGNRWMLRGLVSAGLSNYNICNLSEYIVYTDVAKYTLWIRVHMT